MAMESNYLAGDNALTSSPRGKCCGAACLSLLWCH
jgi:hypothetical protein